MIQIRNETKGTIVADQLQVADSVRTRFWGLLGRPSLPEGHGLLLRPSSSIHTAFMRFAIDVVFLDKENRVVKVVPELKPFRMAVPRHGAHSALELPAGAAAQARVERGDQLLIAGQVAL
ncbi:MAG: DUF192 domain-containing protein [Dehalococcoidia bacterium]